MINDKFDDKTFDSMKLNCLANNYKTLKAFSVNSFNTLTIDKNTQ